MKTRYNGDLHLGQVVLVKDDFYFLDFEGEPLKDVAGVLRFFNYAGCQPPLHLNAVEAERSLIYIWEEAAKAAFLKGYFDTVETCPSYQVTRLLDLFVLEKALYKICYEAVKRPNWLCIPGSASASWMQEARAFLIRARCN